ncbi:MULTISPECIES: efflux RND transporter periplasmic adaptor subunit [unclassified Corallococcus]|uniref:efflux RND transporter periplasmic adaptor subunit n=1 Tax=unclassified Corallococcus TaxID=2685029 RepID=UPI001A8FD06A|nr:MULTISPECIES: efflux RND transporter periplasmic adaptor subunit [unclassified Corallococcus]MBN9685707.1 efflux RND transporter periplasmic adaptor subunit [Corallococcus sp. NCSPR001]WAS82848.1 efflux RND transporter periplasmic adaptor subunit [Corallococcus sp. NCRR]
MKPTRPRLIRIGVTAAVVVLALLAGRWLWRHYQVEPWTRDGRVQADVVLLAPDVSGVVTSVEVQDNQRVTRGQVLFVIDRARFELALRQAEAAVMSQRAVLAQARREAERNQGLGKLVSEEAREQGASRAEQEEGALQQALANRDIAALNLDRSTVRSPVNGIVTNLEVDPGNFATAGQQMVALVDSDSFRVEGYFEETKLPRIRIGAPVTIRLMGEPALLRGHVEGIAAGIEDRERAAGPNLLPNVNPTFSWVRLAQRVPVRIALDSVPEGVRLVSGRTATVTVHEEGDGASTGRNGDVRP